MNNIGVSSSGPVFKRQLPEPVETYPETKKRERCPSIPASEGELRELKQRRMYLNQLSVQLLQLNGDVCDIDLLASLKIVAKLNIEMNRSKGSFTQNRAQILLRGIKYRTNRLESLHKKSASSKEEHPDETDTWDLGSSAEDFERFLEKLERDVEA